jgi:hyperosmotically inducible protein
MNTKLIGICLIAGAQVVTVAGYAADSDSDRSSGHAFVRDSVITTKVKAELAKEKPSTLVKVSVDTDKSGIVVLSGTAKSQFDKDRAESIARHVEGVKMVENKILVKADQ